MKKVQTPPFKAALILLLVAVSGLVWFKVSSQTPAPQITYSEFLDLVEAEEVASVTFRESGEITGVFVGSGQGVPFSTTAVPGDLERLTEDLRTRDVAISAHYETGSVSSIFIELIPLILVVLVLIFLFRRAGNPSAMLAGKEELVKEAPQVTFEDVAGAEEAKADMAEIVDFLKSPERFDRLGGRLPKGVLLSGPPGTGKTLLARAVAGEAGVPFFRMSGSDFMEALVGIGAKRVRDLFKKAREAAPCIVFIDEIDAIGQARGPSYASGGADEQARTLNALLVELDGFDKNSGVITLAATNRPDVLDPALLRPGRFDRQVMVDAPDLRAREAILQVHTRKIPLEPQVALSELARATPGMSGADLEAVVNDAALLAAREGVEEVTNDHLMRSRDKRIMGEVRSGIVLSETERKLTAYHEAGHAIMALLTPGQDPVHKVSIIPRGQAMGLTWTLPERDRYSYSRDFYMGHLAMLCGGRVAEEIVLGPGNITSGAASDISRATDIAEQMVKDLGMSDAVGFRAIGYGERRNQRPVSPRLLDKADEEVDRIITEAMERARKVLEDHRTLLDDMADRLLEVETLEQAEVEMMAEPYRLEEVCQAA